MTAPKEAKKYGSVKAYEKHVADTNKRNKARRAMGLKPGDKREVDHIKPLAKGGSNAKSNLRVVSKQTNRKKAAR